MTACMVSSISPVFTERKRWLTEVERFSQSFTRKLHAEIPTQVRLTSNSVPFPPNCTVKTKEIYNRSVTWAVSSTPWANVFVSQGSGLMECPAWDWGPPASERGRTSDPGPHVKGRQRRLEVQGPLQGGEMCVQVALRRSSYHGNTETANGLMCLAPEES